jgi:hypothetical protein
MSEGVVAGPALAVLQPGDRDLIATCRSAWSSVHASQSAGTEADESALTIYTVSCDKLEDLNACSAMLTTPLGPHSADLLVLPLGSATQPCFREYRLFLGKPEGLPQAHKW